MSRNIQPQSELKLNIVTFFLCIVATITVFNGVLNGNIIANCLHIYNFEPWIYHAESLDPTESSNHIFSDSVDGADANLNPTNVKPRSFAKYLQLNHAISRALKSVYGFYYGAAIDCLLIFTLMMFFMYLYLRSIGINWCIAVAVSVGFTFGGTNMHLHLGWAYETACGVIALYFIERLFQKNSWLNALWASLALVNLGGCPMVHIVVFYSIFLLSYIIARLLFTSVPKRSLFVKFTLMGFTSLLLSIDYLLPTISYFNDNFEKGYREQYGLLQNKASSLFTFLFANFYGHPKSESSRWISGVYINTAMFIGSATFLSAISASIASAILKINFHNIFFLIAALFGTFYAYEFPFETIETHIGMLPLLKWVKAIYFKSVLHLFIAVLGAIGLQYLWADNSRCKYLITSFCSLIMIYVFWEGTQHVNYIEQINNGTTPYLKWYIPLAYGSVIFSILLLLLIGFKDSLGIGKSRFARYALGISLILIFSFETIVHTYGWIPYSKPEHCFPETETTNFLKKKVGNGRIVPLGYAAIPSMISTYTYGVETAAGRMMVKPPYLSLLQQADPDAYKRHPTQYLFKNSTNLQSPVWDLADVKYFVASPNVSLTDILVPYATGSIIPHHFKDGLILERKPPPKHAYLMSTAKLFSDYEAMAEAVSHGMNVREIMALESENDVLPGTLYSDPNNSNRIKGTIKKFKKSENLMEITYKSDRDAYLLLSELYNNNWHAYIEQKKLKTFRAYYFLTGLHVPAGEHKIEIRYELAYVNLANAIVLSTLVGILSILSVGLWKSFQ